MQKEFKSLRKNNEICSYAASGGHLNILQWAKMNGCVCTDKNKYHKD